VLTLVFVLAVSQHFLPIAVKADIRNAHITFHLANDVSTLGETDRLNWNAYNKGQLEPVVWGRWP
jgi:hypothetical protein